MGGQVLVRLHRLRDTLAAADTAAAGEHVARRAQLALILSSLLVLLLLAWSTWDHVRARLERERALAVHVTDVSAERVRRQLHALDAKLNALVGVEAGSLASMAIGPPDPELEQGLWQALRNQFPDLAAALVMDATGSRVVALGEALPAHGEHFLRQFVRGSGDALRLGGASETPHIDLAAAWLQEGSTSGGVLVSLACRDICLAAADDAPEGHAVGLRPARGEDTDVSAGTLLATAAVGETGWVVEDRLDPEHVGDLVHSRVTLGFGLAAIFLLGTTALFRWVRLQGRSASEERRDLRESRIKLDAVLAATTDGILLTDPGGRVELFNPAAEMMFGRLAEDVLNVHVSKLIPDFFSPDAGGMLARDAAETALPVVRETRGRRKGESEFPIRLWLSRARFDGALHLLAVIQDLTEHERNEQHLVFLEQHDVLTGLLNRKEFERRLAALLIEGREVPPGPHALCYLDVDQFKLVNDTCGHEAGDELLKQIAILLKAKLSDGDVVARLGGDEFGLLLVGQGLEDGLRLCDTLMQTVRNFLFTWRDQSFDVALSIGLVEFKAETDTPSSVLSKADVACHIAKSRGRDRVHVYHEGDADLVRHHGDMHLVAAISEALNEGRFHLYAQPILPIAAGAGTRFHFEILVRMVDESGNLVIPDNFIPAAERYILMPSVDRWIINRLFTLQADTLRAWDQSGSEGFLFAVNLSGTSLMNDGFLRYLKRQFTELAIPYRSICFEITETAAVHNLKSARAFMEELAALGCSFALDDFGTGLSSYSYLKELPVDYLKIAGSFVRGMSEDPVNHALVESINQIGHVLRLKTIAEWAEDRNALLQLRAMNVDFAQGFGVGEARPVEGLTLDDTLIPASLQGLTHDPRRGPHLPRGGAPRPT